MSGVLYNQAALKPHKSRSWLNAEPEALAEEHMADLTTLYAHAPAVLAAGERVVSTDEMPGIHALERTHPTRRMDPGQAERREGASLRRGTVTVIAHVDVAHGSVVTPSMGPTRTAEDFVTPMAGTVASDPEATRWPCVVAHLTMPHSEGLVRLVAQHEGLAEDLGTKDQRGRLQSRATRAAFLAAPRHRSVFHSTPHQASWMHQMERWCSSVVRKLLKRASFTSVADLQTRVLAFVDYGNATMAKPFTWTSGQKPLRA